MHRIYSGFNLQPPFRALGWWEELLSPNNGSIYKSVETRRKSKRIRERQRGLIILWVTIQGIRVRSQRDVITKEGHTGGDQTRIRVGNVFTQFCSTHYEVSILN